MSQLRKALKFKFLNYYRIFIQRIRLGYLGHKVWIDKGVQFMRFPKNISIFDNVVVKEGVKICSCNDKAIITIGKGTDLGYYTFLFASNKITMGDDGLAVYYFYSLKYLRNI